MEISKKNARIAGLLYLSVIIFGILAELVVRSSIYNYGDAALTANNIQSNDFLYRFGVVSDIVCHTSHLFLAWVIAMMFWSVSRSAAVFMLSCVIISVGMTYLNLLNHFAPVFLLNGDGYLSSFTPEQLQSISMFFVKMHGAGYTIAGIFFGLWLYPLGYLANKSGYFPKILGTLLMIGCFGYIISTVKYFLFPTLDWLTYPGDIVALVAEFGFCGYLLIKGIKEPKIEQVEMA